MNMKLVGIIVAVAVVGGGIYAFTGSNGTSVDENSSEKELQTFGALVARGESVECTFEHDDGINMSNGVAYMTDGAERIRGDFTVIHNGETMEGHMIRKDGYNYVWGSFYPQGVKMRVTEENRNEFVSGNDDGEATIDENTEFECTSWRVDDSKFDLPAGIEFIDVMAQMQQNMEASMETQGLDCSVCDQAPEGAARTQCLQALGCS